MSLRDDCGHKDCQHDRVSHYRDHQTGERLCCTALHCECTRFWDGKGPEPTRPKPPPSESTPLMPTWGGITWP